MENPFSYRNRLAADLIKGRRLIGQGVEMTRDELFMWLQMAQGTPAYIAAEEKHDQKRKKKIEKNRQRRIADLESFKKQLLKKSIRMLSEIRSLNEKKAEKLLSRFVPKWRGETSGVLNLENLEELTPEAAKVLVEGNINLSLPWKALQEHPRTFRELLKSKKNLVFKDVGKISEKMAQELQPSEQKLQSSGQELFLENITEIPMKSADFLASSEMPISISIRGFISDFALKAIAKNPNIQISAPGDYVGYLEEARAQLEEGAEEENLTNSDL